jgi:archaeal chaperonin
MDMSTQKKRYIVGDPNSGIYNEAVIQAKAKNVRDTNFNITLALAKLITSMFGPKGSKKILEMPAGNFSITQKGYKVIKFAKTRLPITQLLVNVVETQENVCGDGTKTVLLLIAFLLEKAKDLMEQGISAPVINTGIKIALDKALKFLESYTIDITAEKFEFLTGLLHSVLNDKLSHQENQFFIDMLLKNILMPDSLLLFSREFSSHDILFRKIHGKSIKESMVLNGMIIYKNKPKSTLPDKIDHPKILLMNRSLDFFIPDNTKPSREITIKDPAEYDKFLKFNVSYYGKISDFLHQNGINAIFCQKKINPTLVDFCGSQGIIAMELIGEDEIKKLSKMLKVQVISDIQSFSEGEMGLADSIEFKKIANDEMLFISLHPSPILTFLLRGGTNQVLDELEEIISSACRVAVQTIEDRKLLPGGGAFECQIARILKNYSNNFPGKLQYVIYELAKAFENLPAFLIMNSGGAPLDLIPQLRALHTNGQTHAGFDCRSNAVVNVIDYGIFDGYNVKKHLIKLASEAARQILRVDGLVMVYDRELHQKLEAEGKKEKHKAYDEKLRKFFKKEEDGMFTL